MDARRIEDLDLPPDGLTDAEAEAARGGVTLTETLNSVYITGVGTLATLALFPTGADSSAQPIKDDRQNAPVPDATVAPVSSPTVDLNPL